MAEILHIISVSLRSIPGRAGESAVVTVGIACVVFVLVMTLGLASSLTDAVATTGHPDRALVLRNGAVVESLSSLSREDAARLRSLPGIARLPDDDVAVSPEVLVNVYVVAYVVGAIMAFGATCGALNMTYSAVDARTVEVATLRAIGFGAFPITVSVLVESTLLAIVGALAGALLAWIVADGNTFAATQYLGPGASVNHLTLRLDVAAEHMVFGVVWACAIGLIGALLPAVRAANRSIARGLQVV